MTGSPTPIAGTRARMLFAVNAAVAWAGVGLQLVLSVGGFYPSRETVPSLLGYANGAGLAGAFGRTMDYLSYFTILSNIVVAVVMTMLARTRTRDTPVLRVLRLDSLLMIAVTGLVYAVVLAPLAAPQQGWQVVANSLEHQITPVLTILIWLIAGPRGWIRWSQFLPALVIPVIWLGWTLLRGAVIGAYPYGFIDVVTHGYGQVLLNTLAVVVLALVICTVLLGLDRLMERLLDRSDRAPVGPAGSSSGPAA